MASKASAGHAGPSAAEARRATGIRSDLAWLAAHYRGSRSQLLAVAVVAVVMAVLAPAQPQVIRFIFDHAIPTGDTRLLLALSGLLLGLRFAASALSFLARHLTVETTRGITMVVRRDILAALYEQPTEFHDRSAPGRLQKHIVHDTEQLENHMQSVLSVGLPAVLGATMLALMMAAMSWQVTAILALLSPPLWFTTRLSNRLLKRNLASFQVQFEMFNKGVYFVLRHMDLTRTRAFEEGELTRQTAVLGRLRDAGALMSKGFEIHAQIQAMVTSVVAIVLLVSGGLAIQHGMLKVGDFVALYIAAAMLSGQAARITSVLPDLVMLRDVIGRLRALPQRAVPASGARRPARAFKGFIRLEGVSFRRGSRVILREIDLVIEPGRHVAIRGSNGAGKSTLVQLVLGLLGPSEGRLTADGVPYADLDLAALRRQIGFVPQRPDFFGGTIMENIVYGRPEASVEDVHAALAKAGIDEFVAGLPLGLDSMLGEGGVMVSGGQGQRLAIAAALVARPRLLVLDEPTNHLDPASVSAIIATLRQESADVGVLTISHAEALFGSADRVFELTGGRLVETAESIP